MKHKDENNNISTESLVKACELLEENKLPISEIARQSGLDEKFIAAMQNIMFVPPWEEESLIKKDPDILIKLSAENK